METISLLASIDLDWVEELTVSDIIKAFKTAGWKLFDSNGNAFYLPPHDEDFGWVEDKISEEKLQRIFLQKHSLNECIGIVLWWESEEIGITLHIYSDMQTSLLLNVNRKTLEKMDGYFHTDVNWYIRHLIMRLNAKRTIISGYEFSEYV